MAETNGKTIINFPNGKQTEINTGLFINNQFVPSEFGKTIDVINPSTGKLICKVAEASNKDVDRAVDAARAAFNTTWGLNVNGFERARLMQKLSNLLERDAEILAMLEALDNGKTLSMATAADVPKSIDCLRYFAGWADKISGKTLEVNDNTNFTYTRHEPIGVCAQIIPWNFPLLMLAWKFSPAIATGNTVVMKTAEQTPLSALKFCELVVEAGFPPGVFNVVMGYGPTTGSHLSSHPRVDKIAFTGSTAVGRIIMKAAAESNLKNVTLELGGKSPNIIFEDANIAEAIKWSNFGIYFNHGQCCAAGSRIFVQESIFEKFIEEFRKMSGNFKVGDPFAADTFQGPQVSQLQFDRIMKHIDIGKKEAKLLYGGNRVGDEGYFIEQTVFTDVPDDSVISKEEIFGPVVVVNTFKDEDEVIKRANSSEYGLAAGIFTQNLARAHRVAARIQSGTVWINHYNDYNMNVPFGGFKQSGIGRELGEYVLSNYTNVKSVNINLGVNCPF